MLLNCRRKASRGGRESWLAHRQGKDSEDCTCYEQFFDTEAFLFSSDMILYGIWSFFEPLPFFCRCWHVAASSALRLSFGEALLVAGLHNWSSSLITLLSTGAWKSSRRELVQSPVGGDGKAVRILTQVRRPAPCTHILSPFAADLVPSL